jgi:hypothetical protein
MCEGILHHDVGFEAVEFIYGSRLFLDFADLKKTPLLGLCCVTTA